MFWFQKKKKNDLEISEMVTSYNELKNTILSLKNELNYFKNYSFDKINKLEENINNLVIQNTRLLSIEKESGENKKLLNDIIIDHKEYVNFFSSKEEVINNKINYDENLIENINTRLSNNEFLLQNVTSQIFELKDKVMNDESKLIVLEDDESKLIVLEDDESKLIVLEDDESKLIELEEKVVEEEAKVSVLEENVQKKKKRYYNRKK